MAAIRGLRGRIGAVALACCGAILLSPHARAGREAALFEHPVTERVVPARSDLDPVGEITCTYYPDFMIRVTGTNTPSPAPATLIPGSHPPCNAAPVAGAITLRTQAYGFDGRIGPFLAFEASDPNGASGFMIVDAESGRTLYSDGLFPGAIRAVALAGDALRIKFTRAMNLSCSILRDGAACWAKAVAEGKIPRALAHAPPPVQACKASYPHDKIDDADDPSEITYDVDMMLSRSGKPRVISRGAVGCLPQP